MMKNKANSRMFKKCKRCKKTIEKESLHDYCGDCYKILDEVFEKIRNYLEEYPGATAYEIEIETKIPLHVIKRFVKEGRLIKIPNEFIHIDCKRCGVLLLSAHSEYCPKCRDDIKKEIEEAQRELINKNNEYKIGKMHTKYHKANNKVYKTE